MGGKKMVYDRGRWKQATNVGSVNEGKKYKPEPEFVKKAYEKEGKRLKKKAKIQMAKAHASQTAYSGAKLAQSVGLAPKKVKKSKRKLPKLLRSAKVGAKAGALLGASAMKLRRDIRNKKAEAGPIKKRKIPKNLKGKRSRVVITPRLGNRVYKKRLLKKK